MPPLRLAMSARLAHAQDAAAEGAGVDVRGVTPLRIDVPRENSPGLGALLRDAVESGAEDGPAEVWMDGRLIFRVRRIHAAALFTVLEEPHCRHAAWTPHPRTEVGPRVRALIEAREVDRRLRREYGA